MTACRVLFYRHFDQFSGGQQKVRDYYAHLEADDRYCPAISFSESSVWDVTNPWPTRLKEAETMFDPDRYDCLFLAGMDWQAYESVGIIPDKPVVNLVQHVRHADPQANVYPFLRHRAIRICVSSQVATAIRSTGLVNGPVVTIANGIELPMLGTGKKADVFIAGRKNPELALALRSALSSTSTICHTEPIPRDEFLVSMAGARIAVLLPDPTEGFFLPALEAMALCDLVVVPDCIGNRSFCRDFERDPVAGNCLMPEYRLEDLVQATSQALGLLGDSELLEQIQRTAQETVGRHSLARERRQFLELMSSLDTLWAGT
jgi:hypothetical protein